MKVFIVNGSPRKSGYTAELLRRFSAGIEKSGGIPDIADLGRLDVRPCRGCYGCWHPGSLGRCVINDDMAVLIERYLSADAVVFATPLYFYSFSSLMKAFIERLLATLSPELSPGETPEMVHHTRRDPDSGPNRGALIVVAGHRDTAILSGVLPTFSLITKALHLDWVGTLARTESFFLDFGVGKEKTIRKIHEAFENAGKELVENGRISDETARAAASPIAKDLTTFLRQTAGFWNVARDGPHFVSEREPLKAAVLKDLRIVMPAVAACFDPAIGADIDAVINFDIDGTPDGKWHFRIRDGRCTCDAGLADTAVTTIVTDAETWTDILKLRLDARTAYVQKKIIVHGDNRLFARFPRLFPNPST